MLKYTVMILSLLPSIGVAGLSTFTCNYTHNCNVEDGCSESGFTLKFMLDTITHDAFMIGNNGMSEVYFHLGTDGVSFIEFLQTGAAQTTTIAFDQTSAHSRNSIILSEMLASQYYGTCDVETDE